MGFVKIRNQKVKVMQGQKMEAEVPMLMPTRKGVSVVMDASFVEQIRTRIRAQRKRASAIFYTFPATSTLIFLTNVAMLSAFVFGGY